MVIALLAVIATGTGAATGAMAGGGGPGGVSDVPLPEGYRLSLYRSPTPEVVPGAVTVDAGAVAGLAAGGAVLVDVLPATATGLGGRQAWIPNRDHRNIPGSVWLPNVGEGRLAPPMDGWYRSWLERLTGGDRGHPLVLYCKADCWLSWNAARRALAYGYTAVHWFRDGVEGWEESGRTLTAAQPAGPPPEREGAEQE